MLIVSQPQANDRTGVSVRRRFDPKNAVHLTRKHKCYGADDGLSYVAPIPCETGLTPKLSGINRIDGFFDTWVKKNSVIGEELSKTFDYQRLYKNFNSSLGTSPVEIYAYDGEGDTHWLHDESGNLLPNFRHVCTLMADLTGLQNSLKAENGPQGQRFWRVCYSGNVRFGGTALKARMTWYEGVSTSHFHPWRC